MVSIKFILGAAVSATLASAHMELLWPPALRSKYNSLTPEPSIGEYFLHTLGPWSIFGGGRWTRADYQTTR